MWNFFMVRPPVSICPVSGPTVRRQPGKVNAKVRGVHLSVAAHRVWSIFRLTRLNSLWFDVDT